MAGDKTGNQTGDKAGISGLSSAFLGGAPIQPAERKAGEVVFSAEALQVFRKMDILRLERNNKRGERRKAGEKDVSDDEGGELTPFVMVAPSGEKSQPSWDPDAPVQSADGL